MQALANDTVVQHVNHNLVFILSLYYYYFYFIFLQNVPKYWRRGISRVDNDKNINVFTFMGRDILQRTFRIKIQNV